MSKKGAMELGINTVVVLVIALVVIAGGIAFITGVFDDIQDVGPIEMPNLPATSDQPLVFAGTEPTIKRGDKENLDISVYNKLGVDKEITLEFVGCATDAINTGCDDAYPVLIAMPQTISSGEYATFRTMVTAKCASDASLKLSSGQYVCSLRAITTDESSEIVAESQIIITVSS